MRGHWGRKWIAMAALVAGLAPASARAGAWTTEEGTLWSKIAVFHMNSDRIFANRLRRTESCVDGRGDRVPYDCTLEGGGGLKTTHLFLEAALGLHDRVDLAVQVPVVLQGRFKSDKVRENSRGLGDIRIRGKVLALSEPLVLSAGWEVKAPTGDFVVDAVQFPLGEGQWDVAFRALAARSFLEGRLWVGSEIGYRFRTANEAAGIDVGDEVLAVLESGARPLQWLYVPLRWELQWGFENEQLDGPLAGQGIGARRVLFLQTGLMVNPLAHLDHPLSDLGVEGGVRYPVWGIGWPADPVWFVGITQKVALWQ